MPASRPTANIRISHLKVDVKVVQIVKYFIKKILIL